MGRKNTIIVVVVVAAAIVLIAGGYLYWKNSARSGHSLIPASATSSVQSAVDAASAITQSATQGTLPSLGGAVNPLQNKPDVNPADAANPFNSVKTNPFQ